MKRVGNIFGAVVERENLRDAFLKASRGKRHRFDQRQYADNLDNELDRLREGFLNVDYPVGNYRRFKIYDPKEREICVAPFGERVLHHALMNVCEPWFDKWLVFDTYACRAGKGQLRAVKRAAQFAAEADSRGFRQKYFRAHPISGNSNRVLRGGSYNNDASNCTFAYRNNNNPSNDWNNNGFRLFCRSAWNARFDPGRCPVSGDGTNERIRPDASSARRTLRGGVFA